MRQQRTDINKNNCLQPEPELRAIKSHNRGGHALDEISWVFQILPETWTPSVQSRGCINSCPLCSFSLAECSRGFWHNFLHIQSNVSEVLTAAERKYTPTCLAQIPLKINKVCERAATVVLLWTKGASSKSGQTLSTLHTISMTECKNTSRNKCFLKWFKFNIMQHEEMHIFKAAQWKPVSLNLQSERFTPCTHTFLTAYPFLVRWDGSTMQSKRAKRRC